MKKILSVVLLCAMLISAFAACAVKQEALSLDAYPTEGNAENASYTSQTAWDGSASDTSWYTGNPSASTFYIEDGADLKGFISLVYSSTPVTFAGKTIQLKKDINLGKKTWSIPDVE